MESPLKSTTTFQLTHTSWSLSRVGDNSCKSSSGQIMVGSSRNFSRRFFPPYLKTLAEAWRCEFYHYSIRQDSFQRMDQAEVYDPRTMTLSDWLAILCLQYADYKSSLTTKEMEFTQNRLISKIVENKPLGYKPKVALPA